MPRRRGIAKRPVVSDPVYGDQVITKFQNCLMIDGKKAVAEQILYEAMDMVADRTREDPVVVFHRALEASKPLVEVKSRRVGGSTYQVPIEVHPIRQEALAIRWIIAFARKRGGKNMVSNLANELMEASHRRGGAVKKKEDVHRMAEANRAFAHYRW